MSPAVPLKGLLPFSAFDHTVWDIDRPVTREEVRAAIDAGHLEGTPRPEAAWCETRDYHIRRIAHLVVHGWQDAIEVDVGVPVLGFVPDWIVIDGNHRLAAAIFRGDAAIHVEVGGQLDYAAALFGVDEDSLSGQAAV